MLSSQQPLSLLWRQFSINRHPPPSPPVIVTSPLHCENKSISSAAVRLLSSPCLSSSVLLSLWKPLSTAPYGSWEKGRAVIYLITKEAVVSKCLMNAWDTLMYREMPLALSGRTKEKADRPDIAFGLRKTPALSAAHPFLPPLVWFHAKILSALLMTWDTKWECVAEKEIKSGHLIYSLSLFLR